MKIIITGASGFLGFNLLKKLEKTNHNVILLDSNNLKEKTKHTFIKTNLVNKNEYEKQFKGADIVFHFASISDIEYSKKHSTETIETNILSTKHILDISSKYKIKHFIFASTIYVNSNKGSFYRISKQTCENMILEFYREKKLNFNILRFGTIFGPGSSSKNSVHEMIYQGLKFNKITVKGDGSEIREYIYIDDAIDQALSLINNKKLINKCLNITGNSRIKLKDLVGIIQEIFPKKIKIIFGKSKLAHYKYSPYKIDDTYISKKMTMSLHTDIGEGIVNLYKYIQSQEA